MLTPIGPVLDPIEVLKWLVIGTVVSYVLFTLFAKYAMPHHSWGFHALAMALTFMAIGVVAAVIVALIGPADLANEYFHSRYAIEGTLQTHTLSPGKEGMTNMTFTLKELPEKTFFLDCYSACDYKEKGAFLKNVQQGDHVSLTVTRSDYNGNPVVTLQEFTDSAIHLAGS